MIALLVHGQSFKSDPATEQFITDFLSALLTVSLEEIQMKKNKHLPTVSSREENLEGNYKWFKMWHYTF